VSAIKALLDQIFVYDKVTLPSYGSITTYEDYFTSRTDLQTVLTTYTALTDYETIAANILNNLIVVDTSFSTYTTLNDNASSTECLYNILRRFTSYTVNYITTVADLVDYQFTPYIATHHIDDITSQTYIPNIGVIDIESIEHINLTESIIAKELSLNTTLSVNETERITVRNESLTFGNENIYITEFINTDLIVEIA
jgi:hypothetical protein